MTASPPDDASRGTDPDEEPTRGLRGQPAPKAAPPSPPRSVGRYLILEEVGRGGMGVVYRAYDPELDRKVAVKVVAGERGSQEESRRLLREAQAMAKLAHPNIVA